MNLIHTKKTILFIGNYFESEKSNRNVWFELPSRLKQSGFGVMLTSRKVPKPIRLLDMIWNVLSKQSEYQIAHIDTFSGSAFFWAEVSAWLLRKIQKPYILSLRGGNLPVYAQNNSKRVKRVFDAAQAVIAPSAYLQQTLKEYRDDIQVIPNPISTAAFPYHHRKTLEPNLVWVRAFHEIYNPSLAPRIIHKLIETFPDVCLTMVGPDKGDGSLQHIKELASSLSVTNHITLTGGVQREEIPSILEKNDIFINTTNYDNMPVSVIEAMACGLCIVTTNVGGIPWLIEDGVDGLLVPPDDPLSMVEAISRLLTDPNLAGRVSKNARSKAENLDWSTVITKWLDVYDKP